MGSLWRLIQPSTRFHKNRVICCWTIWWCVWTSLAKVNRNILKQQGLSCYCTATAIVAPNKEHTCLIWANGSSQPQWSRGDAPITRSKTLQGKQSRELQPPAFYLKTARCGDGRGERGACCHVGERYPQSTSSPVFPGHLSHLAISSGEPLIVPPRAVRKAWRWKKLKARHKDGETLRNEIKRDWTAGNTAANDRLLNVWRILQSSVLRCNFGWNSSRDPANSLTEPLWIWSILCLQASVIKCDILLI